MMLWVRISTRARYTTLCDKVCQWLATGWWFSPGSLVSSTNKTDCHDITEILLKVTLNTYQTNKQTYKADESYISLATYVLSLIPINQCSINSNVSVYREDMVKMFGTDTIKASADGSYKCIKETSFALQDGFVMNTYNLQYAAFQTNITSFSNSGIYIY